MQRIVEGAELAPFKQYFATWRDAGMQHTRLIRAANDGGKVLFIKFFLYSKSHLLMFHYRVPSKVNSF